LKKRGHAADPSRRLILHLSVPERVSPSWRENHADRCAAAVRSVPAHALHA